MAVVRLPDFEIRDGVLITYRGDGGAIKLPSGIDVIGEEAFRGCEGLTSIDMGYDPVQIRERAFEKCTALAEIELPYMMGSISPFAFAECKSLHRIYLPRLLYEVLPGAFEGCHALTTVTVDPENEWMRMMDGCLVDVAEKWLLFGLDHSQIPTGGAVTKIQARAFAHTYLAEELVIPNGVREIGEYAFFGCKTLTRVVIPASVERIGVGAFAACTELVSIEVAEDNTRYVAVDGCLVERENRRLLKLCKGSKFPTGNCVRVIGQSAFEGDDMTEFEVPWNIVSVEARAFADCTALEKITFGRNLLQMGAEAFRGCASLVEVAVPYHMVSLGEACFYDCDSILRVQLPSHLISRVRTFFDPRISFVLTETQPEPKEGQMETRK